MSIFGTIIGFVVYIILAWCLGFFVFKSIKAVRKKDDRLASVYIMAAVLWAILIVKWTVGMDK